MSTDPTYAPYHSLIPCGVVNILLYQLSGFREELNLSLRVVLHQLSNFFRALNLPRNKVQEQLSDFQGVKSSEDVIPGPVEWLFRGVKSTDKSSPAPTYP